MKSDGDLVDAALTIAEERERATRHLARAVLDGHYQTARQLAKELLPNESLCRSWADQHYTDKEFCAAFKIDRATSRR